MATRADSAQASATLRERIESVLSASLPREGDPRLLEAMRYAVTGGGKRLRPLLVYHAGHMANAPMERLDAVAAAVEMVHAYSLIHDDLPAMDDDDLRRGQPTCHVAFDEATAILAGDALQARAFEILAGIEHPEASRVVEMIGRLARAAGPAGMAGGQAMDLALTGHSGDLAHLEHLHRLKTGALIEASLMLGALAADQRKGALEQQLDTLGQTIGLAFQIQDDVLDVISDTDTLGKAQGADAARDKPTFASLQGVEAAETRFRCLYQEAMEQLADAGPRAVGLQELIRQMRDRRH